MLGDLVLYFAIFLKSIRTPNLRMKNKYHGDFPTKSYDMNGFFLKTIYLHVFPYFVFPAPSHRGGGDDVDFARPLGAPKTAKRVSSAPAAKSRISTGSKSSTGG